MPRLQKTLADYAVIAISPALIMVLIGSLVFFLVEAFYQGQYEARVRWIFGCFVFAAVLISRISIEEGREHAALFAIPLAIVMLLAVSKFLAMGLLAGIVLIALILWSADKLTWDCTVVDEHKDASGEGLLQTVGLDRPGEPQTGEVGEPADLDLDATSSRQLPPAESRWARFLQKRRQTHAPGVWVVYLSLAALPLFGIGQRFIPASDLEARRSAFWLLCYFAASALGLLLTSSFLGLRRYLRQRRLEMPLEMAGVWLGTGAAMIAVLLVLCTALPRPHPEYSITHARWQVGSAADVQASRHGAGQDGARDDRKIAAKAAVRERSAEPPATSGSAGQPPQSQSPGAASGERGAASGKSETGGGNDSQSQADAQSADAQSGDAQSGDARPQRPAQSPQGESQSGRAGSKRTENGARSQQSDPPTSDGSPGSQAATQPESSDAAGSTETRSQQPAAGSQPQRAADGSAGESDSSSHGQSQQPPPSEEPSQDPADTDSGDNAAPDEGSSGGVARNLPSPAQVLNRGLGILPYLLKGLYYLAFIALAAYLVWRYWAEVLVALQGFVAAVREFWANLFGLSSEPEVREEPLQVAIAPPRPFSAFRDPFSSGDVQRYSPRELVVYSFGALEAWGREHQCPRGQDETPHEFAHRLRQVQGDVGLEARGLADLYCEEAYSQQPLNSVAVSRLERLWQSLRSRPQQPAAGSDASSLFLDSAEAKQP